MDTFTQMALGAAVAQAAFGAKLGGKAVVLGAACGLLPDLDTVSSLAGPWASMVHHRGLTHSLFFAPVVAPLLGWLGWRWAKGRGRYVQWVHLSFWAVVTHPLLDLFTSYGTQLLWPFSRSRFALDAIAIIDPIYTVPLLVALGIAWVTRKRPRIGQWAAGLALALTTIYLALGYRESQIAQHRIREQLAAEGFEVAHMRAQPSLLIWLWRVVAINSRGDLRVGVISTWSPARSMNIQASSRPVHPLVDAALQSSRGQLFTWFADGIVGVRLEQAPRHTVVTLDDQRYGRASEPMKAFWGARAVFDGDAQLQSMERVRYRDFSMGSELSLMWTMMRDGAGAEARTMPEAALPLTSQIAVPSSLGSTLFPRD